MRRKPCSDDGHPTQPSKESESGTDSEHPEHRPAGDEQQHRGDDADDEGDRSKGGPLGELQRERACVEHPGTGEQGADAKYSARLAMTPTTAAVMPVRAPARARLLRSRSM